MNIYLKYFHVLIFFVFLISHVLLFSFSSVQSIKMKNSINELFDWFNLTAQETNLKNFIFQSNLKLSKEDIQENKKINFNSEFILKGAFFNEKILEKFLKYIEIESDNIDVDTGDEVSELLAFQNIFLSKQFFTIPKFRSATLNTNLDNLQTLRKKKSNVLKVLRKIKNIRMYNKEDFEKLQNISGEEEKKILENSKNITYFLIISDKNNSLEINQGIFSDGKLIFHDKEEFLCDFKVKIEYREGELKFSELVMFFLNGFINAKINEFHMLSAKKPETL